MLIPFVSSSSLDRFGDDNGLLMLVVTCTGIIVVFLVLIILIMVFNMFGAFGKQKKSLPQPSAKKSLDSAPSKNAVASAPIAGALPASASGVSEEIIAAISAAVAVTLDGKPFVIKRVRRVPSGGSAWSRAGVLENTRPF